MQSGVNGEWNSSDVAVFYSTRAQRAIYQHFFLYPSTLYAVFTWSSSNYKLYQSGKLSFKLKFWLKVEKAEGSTSHSTVK